MPDADTDTDIQDDVAEKEGNDIAEMVSQPGDAGYEAPASPPEASEAPAFGNATLERAKKYGLSSDDIAGFDEGRLDRMFSAIDRRIMGPGPNPVEPQQAPITQGAVQPPAGQPGNAPPAADGQQPYIPLSLTLSEDLDEAMSGPLNSVVEHLNSQMQEIHSFRQAAIREMQAMTMLREFDGFDSFIHGLGDEWVSTYGKGSTVDMDQNSPEFKKRMEAFYGSKTLGADAQKVGQRLTVGDAQLRSHRGIHWDRIAEMEREKLNGKIEKRRRGMTERPSKGETPALSPREEAIAAWQ